MGKREALSGGSDEIRGRSCLVGICPVYYTQRWRLCPSLFSSLPFFPYQRLGTRRGTKHRRRKEVKVNEFFLINSLDSRGGTKTSQKEVRVNYFFPYPLLGHTRTSLALDKCPWCTENLCLLFK